MTSLDVKILDARAQPYAAVPTIMFKMRLTEAEGAAVHAVALRCQIMIEPQRRSYDKAEEDRLYELFDEPRRWGETLHPSLWGHTGMTVTAFEGTTEVDLPMPVTYDFEVSGTKYLHNVRDGVVPLQFMFAGTIFTRGDTGFAAEPIGWNKDAAFQMPAKVWHDTMDLYFPNSGWLRVRRDTMDALTKYKSDRALPTWEAAFEQLLKEAGEDV